MNRVRFRVAACGGRSRTESELRASARRGCGPRDSKRVAGVSDGTSCYRIKARIRISNERRDVFRGYHLLFADGGVSATAVRRCGAAANCTTLRVAFSQCFYTLPFVRTKCNPKAAAVKRFRGRPQRLRGIGCFAFLRIKISLTQTFSRLGKARTSSALPSAYRKRSPILHAPSPRPPFSRNRFCRG